MRADREGKPAVNLTVQTPRRVPVRLGAWFVILVLASLSVFAVACGGDPTATPTAAPEPAPTTAPDPSPTAAPEPAPTAAPEPAPTAAPEPAPTAAPEPAPTAAPEPAPTATPEPAPPEPTDAVAAKSDDQLTREYVMRAIERYDRDGREAAFAYYNSRESLEGARSMFIFDPATHTFLVTLARPDIIGIPFIDQDLGEVTALLLRWIEVTADGEGWLESHTPNPHTGQLEPKRSFGVLHDGLIFTAGHSILQENIADATKNYVNKATRYYDENGREDTAAHYNSRDSMDGFFYLFLMDENDTYLAHPIRHDLRGTDIKEVTGKDFDGNFYELGKAIAMATEEGHWVEYLWLNPVNGRDEAKTTWAIRHDGLIFASGYYNPVSDDDRPLWVGADPREYTLDYVNRAIQRYEEDGLDAMVAYYDSVASFEGEWYLFATDADDIYIVHPFRPNLKGTDIKDVVRDGFELGKELAAAGEGEGVWVEYQWPHPATLREATKVSYAVRKDGILFASGYYPAPKDLPAFARTFVQEAIDLYEKEGLDAVKELYGAGDNSDGLWFLLVLDENGIYLVNGTAPQFVGLDLNQLPLVDLDGNPAFQEVAKATEAGRWVSIPWLIPNGPENLIAHAWVVRHDDLFFSTLYYDTLRCEPSPYPTGPCP